MKWAFFGLALGAASYIWTGQESARGESLSLRGQDSVWTWRGTVAAGKTLEIRGVSGSIAAEAASGNQAEVRAEKRARRDDPDEVRIEVVEHEGGVTICAVYPGRRNRCEPGGGPMSVRDNDVNVEFTVKVPRGVSFVGANVNGGVEAIDLTGPVELATVNGGVRLETSSGDARANTVNGSITAVVTGATGQHALSFQTVNGGITVTLPREFNADLEAETVNGSISPDFPVQVMGRLNPRRLMGRIGQGGRTLRLQTVNGSIRLRQRT